MLMVMVGPSGAGKSTLIETELQNFFATVVSSDAIRMELNGNIEDQSNNHNVFKTFHERIAFFLNAGFDVIADATHLKRADRLKTTMIGLNLGIPVYYIVVNRPVEEKNKTSGWRSNIILPNGKTLIQAHEDLFQQNREDILSGDYLENVYVRDYSIIAMSKGVQD